MERKNELIITTIALVVLAIAFVVFLIVLLRGAADPVAEEHTPAHIVQTQEQQGDSSEVVEEEPAVLSVAFMVHLEGWSDEVEDESAYESHVAAVQKLRTVFDRYEAKLTLEASPEFIEADAKWGQGWLQKWEQAGHGIGVHADVGGTQRETQETMTTQMRLMKSGLEELLGHEVLHVSGVCSHNDWVEATIDAEYEFVTGIVGYCAMALPVALRPAEYRACENPGACHGTLPTTIAERLHPWSTSDGSNWLVSDENGALALIPGTGVVKGLDENSESYLPSDIDAYEIFLRDAVSLAEPGKVNVFYTGTSIGAANINEDLYSDLLARTQAYVDAGLVHWKTLPEIYLEYKAN